MLKLRSNPNSISEVESIVEQLLDRYKIDRDLYPNILISLTEAVSNAINHGNCRDSSKYVHIESNKEGNELKLRVRDEGSGFDYSHVPDPTIPANIHRLGGRGVFLIRELCHHVKYVDEGRTVEMCFKIK